MDFFDRQAQARKLTRRLFWLFGLILLAVLVVNNLLLCPLVACFTSRVIPRSPSWSPFNVLASAIYLAGEALVYPRHYAALVFHWQPMLWISLGTVVSIAAGSYYKIRELSEGGAVVAEFLGGRRVAANPADPDERRLRDVVEEMAIASGTPVPEIYVLDCERGINAFAAGHTRDDVAIGVTRGGVQLLTRDELQGIIAHEFSHILNGDTRLNMKLIGLAHGLFWPTLLGRVLIYGRVDGPDSTPLLGEKEPVKMAPTAPLGALLVVLGCFSLPFVRLLKSAICRQREWLADAAAVQFTRNAEGIAGALKKIGGLPKAGRLDTPDAEVASHLYFASCHYPPWFAFLATHPPLPKRITAIDPRFDGAFPKVKMLAPNEAEREEAYARMVTLALAEGRQIPRVEEAGPPLVTSDQLRRAAIIRLALPAEIKTALRTAAGAAGVVYALLLSDDDDAVRARQMEILRANLAAADYQQFCQLQPQVESLDDKYKLPLAEYAVPALRENDPETHASFQKIQQQLAECNHSLDLFEYTLTQMVRRQLRAHFEGPVLGQPRFGRAGDVAPECALLLSALAHVGNADETEARKAFAAGAEFLDLGGKSIEFITRSEWDLAGVDAALTTLAGYHEPLRRNVLLACGKTVAADQHVTLREAELLRAIADALGCEIPPFVEAIRRSELIESRPQP